MEFEFLPRILQTSKYVMSVNLAITEESRRSALRTVPSQSTSTDRVFGCTVILLLVGLLCTADLSRIEVPH